MRILQTCTTFYAGGIQRHMMELSESLREKNHDVFLAGTPGPWLDETTTLPYLPLNLLGISTHAGKNSLLRRISTAFKCALKLRKFLKENRIELIHAHESAPAIVARIASLGMKIPIVVTYHGSAPGRVKPFGYTCRLTARLVITPSHRCAVELHEQAGISKDHLKVIGLGVAPPPVIETDRVAQHRKELLKTDGKILVVIIARLDHQKGIDILIEVVQQVKKQRKDVRFVVVGDGRQRDDVRKWAKEAKVESHLEFVGQNNEPYLFLMAADIFLLTSRWEALPITIAEAFQVGLPVVATNTGGVKELVSPTTGFVESIGDVAALSSNILKLSSDDNLRKSMSEEAIKLSKEDRFSIPHIHNIFEKTYMDILNSKI